MSDKIKVSFEIRPNSLEMLKQLKEKYELPDESKVLRCILEYVAQDGDKEQIFGVVRCHQCS
jgi:hypothetical protein